MSTDTNVGQTMPQSVVLRLAGRQWAMGAFWTSAENAPVRQDVLTRAQELGASAYAERRLTSTRGTGGNLRYHLGYYRLPSRLRGAIFSLGMALADRRHEGWSGTFELPDGRYLYIAILEDHAVDPGAHGEVVGNRHDVDSARSEQLVALPHEEGTLADLEAMLRDSNTRVRVSKVSGTRRGSRVAQAIAGLVVAAGFLSVGWHWWQGRIAERREAVAAAAARARAARLAAEHNPLVTLTPTPRLFRECHKAIDRVPLSAPDGAASVRLNCTSAGLGITWQRLDGELTQSMVRFAPYVNPVIAHGQVPLVPRVPSAAQELSALREIAARGAFTVAVASNALPGMGQRTRGMGVQLKMDYSPWSVPLEALPGLRITKIERTGSQWILTGAFYQ